MPDSTPTPDPTTESTAGAPATGLWIPVTHQLVRQHDGSVVSSHCCATCGAQALEDLAPSRMIGPNSPGPLERVWVDLIDVATGDSVEFTGTLTPLNGEPPRSSPGSDLLVPSVPQVQIAALALWRPSVGVAPT